MVYLVRENCDELIARIQKAQAEDQDLGKIIQDVRDKKTGDFTLKREVLYKESGGNTLLVVPRSMQNEVIQQAHEKGHFGWRKTEHAIQQDFWFPGLRGKIEKFINNCVKCILAEKKQGKREGLLNPIQKGTRPLDTYHVGHLDPIISTRKNYNHLFVVVDSFTKFCWIYPTKTTNAIEVIDRLRKQATIFGNPRRIVSDRGSAFTSNAFTEYCKAEALR